MPYYYLGLEYTLLCINLAIHSSTCIITSHIELSWPMRKSERATYHVKVHINKVKAATVNTWFRTKAIVFTESKREKKIKTNTRTMVILLQTTCTVFILHANIIYMNNWTYIGGYFVIFTVTKTHLQWKFLLMSGSLIYIE